MEFWCSCFIELSAEPAEDHPVTSGRGPHVCSLAQGPHATNEKNTSVLNIFKMYNEETCREFTQNGRLLIFINVQ